MKRFVTYLYKYERGSKDKNVGFIRVKACEDKTEMEVFLRNIVCPSCLGKMFVLIYKEELIGIELGEVYIQDGKSDVKYTFQTENIEGSGWRLKDVIGIAIRLEDGSYVASAWKDVYGEIVAWGDFSIQRLRNDIERDNIEETTISSVEKFDAEEVEIESLQTKFSPTYEKIDLSQIRDLPSPNWHLTSNSFLVHGFWNYGYLVLKKDSEEGKEILSLGIPGVFEKPEAVMAILFGFPSFEEIPTEMVEKNKNQEPKEGTFGCWFARLKI